MYVFTIEAYSRDNHFLIFEKNDIIRFVSDRITSVPTSMETRHL